MENTSMCVGRTLCVSNLSQSVFMDTDCVFMTIFQGTGLKRTSVRYQKHTRVLYDVCFT